ncbi:MAG: hypothetical protein ACJA1P_001588 [Maribacter sp.]|jgi:hypothetical protein
MIEQVQTKVVWCVTVGAFYNSQGIIWDNIKNKLKISELIYCKLKKWYHICRINSIINLITLQ